MRKAEDVIAEAIAKADTSYFFENYNKQAKAVLAALKKEGLRLVPHSATEEMEAAGTDIIRRGRVKPSEFVRAIYDAMVAAARP